MAPHTWQRIPPCHTHTTPVLAPVAFGFPVVFFISCQGLFDRKRTFCLLNVIAKGYWMSKQKPLTVCFGEITMDKQIIPKHVPSPHHRARWETLSRLLGDFRGRRGASALTLLAGVKTPGQSINPKTGCWKRRYWNHVKAYLPHITRTIVHHYKDLSPGTCLSHGQRKSLSSLGFWPNSAGIPWNLDG